MQITHY